MIIPISVKIVFFEGQGGHLPIRHRLPGRVAAFIQFRLERQTAFCRRMADEVDDHFVTCQRTTTPILGNMTKHSMLCSTYLCRAENDRRIARYRRRAFEVPISTGGCGCRSSRRHQPANDALRVGCPFCATATSRQRMPLCRGRRQRSPIPCRSSGCRKESLSRDPCLEKR